MKTFYPWVRVMLTQFLKGNVAVQGLTFTKGIYVYSAKHKAKFLKYSKFPFCTIHTATFTHESG